MVSEWATYLLKQKLWSGDEPLFPAAAIASGEDQLFKAVGLDREHWSTATPIRTIFREAFLRASLPYFNPHTLRKTLARLGEQTYGESGRIQGLEPKRGA